ncbi:MAG TPA: hypothetical protein VD973_21560 [Symbiobacteriaceae bacterium]|nr:hypothetical protein [Symbiobacteriaceae bacterium]
MEQVLVSLLVYVITWALCLWKPNAARIFLGIFFLVMAWGVNFTICLIDPHLFVPLGSGSFVPLYQTIFTDIVGAAPLLFGLIAVAYETTTGLLILSSGRRAQAGLIMGIIFLVGITPLSLATQANPVLALALQYLLFQPHTHSLPQQLRFRFARS